MLGWRPIAALDDIQAARARAGATTARHASDDHVPLAPPTAHATVRRHGLQMWAEDHGRDLPAPQAEPRQTPGRTRLSYLSLRRGAAQPAATDKAARGADGTLPPTGTDAPDLYHPGATEAPQMAKYLSRQWVEAGRRTVENDPRFKAHTEGISASILCVIEEQPAHADEVFYIDFADGHIRDLYSGPRHEFEGRGAQPTFTVVGDYETFREIQTGKLTQSTALMRGRLRLKGSLLKALKYMKALESVTEILRETPTEY